MSEINALDKIVSFGFIEEEFPILRFKVRMRTITSGELADISTELSGFDDFAKLRGIQIKTLAKSIMAVNGTPIQYASTDKKETITEEKKHQQNEEIISRWQKNVVEVFYAKYIELEGKQSDFLSEYAKQSKTTGADKNGKSENSSV